MNARLTPMQHGMLRALLNATPNDAAAYWHGVPGLRQRTQHKLVIMGLIVVGARDQLILTTEGRKRAQESN